MSTAEAGLVLANPTEQLRTDATDGDLPPPVLLQYQQDWLADQAQLKVMEKSRRIGASWAEAADAVLICAAEHGSNYFYISATQDMAREFVEACALWSRAYHVAAGALGEGLWDDGDDDEGNRRYIKTFEISFPHSGRRIVALSSRPTNLRGKQGTVGIDEAAFHPNLKELLKAALAMLLWGDRVRIWSTHDGVENAFNELIQEIRAGKRGSQAEASVHRVTFRQAVAEGLYRRVCLRKGIAWTQAGEDAWVAAAYRFYGDAAAEELDAVPSASAGAYLSLALIEHRMVTAWPEADDGPVIVRAKWEDGFAYLPEDIRRHAIAGWIAEEVQPHLDRLNKLLKHVYAQDFGRSIDQSVIVVGQEDTDLTHRPRITVELHNCPFSSQQQIGEHIIRALPRWRGGAVDSTGNGAALGEGLAQIFGAEMVEQVKLNDSFYLAHMPKLKAGLQDGTLRDLARDAEHRDDLRAIKVVQGVPKVPREARQSAGQAAAAAEGGSKQKRHGDFGIALFLMEYAFSREAGEIAWTPAPARSSRWDGGNSRKDDLVDADLGRKGGW